MPLDLQVDWAKIVNNPPALLPIPNKEREAAEALLMEFAEWFTEAGHAIQAYDSCAFLSEKNVTDFLSQKFK